MREDDRADGPVPARPRGAGTPAPGRDRRAHVHREGGTRAQEADPRDLPRQARRGRRPGALAVHPARAGGGAHRHLPRVLRRVLRRFALEAGIDPDFTVLEEALALSVRSEALARALREWLSVGDPDLIELATEFGLESVRQSLLDLIAHRSVGELGEWRDRSARELVGTWEDIWEKRGRFARLHAVARASRACLSLLSAHESSHEVMRRRRAFLLEELPNLEHGAVTEEWLDAIHECAKVQGGGTKKHWASPEIHEEVGAAFKKLREEIKAFQKRCRWDDQVTLEAAEHGLRFARLAHRAREVYDAAKRERGALDFDDLLRKTRDLLREDASRVRSGLDRSTAFLLVDEFQDTDPMQGEILEAAGRRRARARAGSSSWAIPSSRSTASGAPSPRSSRTSATSSPTRGGRR